MFFQDWAGWGIFTVIPGNPRRTKGDSQHLEARPELQDWLRSELFTVKNSRTGPFSNYLGTNFELYSRKRGQKKGVNLWWGRDFLVPIPSVRQPLFETSDYTHKIIFFSNYLGRYSYRFRARRELFSITITVLWV